MSSSQSRLAVVASNALRSDACLRVLLINELLQGILKYVSEDFLHGRRTLARLARTCKLFEEPALAMLWRELEYINPVIALRFRYRRVRLRHAVRVSVRCISYATFTH